MAEFKGKKGHWVTTESGSHIFIEDGGSFEEAVEKAFGKENASKYKKYEDNNNGSIKDKVKNYFENYAFNDDADIDESNAMLESIEKELPFKDEEEHKKWLDIVSTGTGEEIEEFTNEIANRDDFDSDYDFESWNDDLSDEDIMMEVADGDYYYGDLDNEQDIYNLVAKRLNITPERAEQALKKQGFDFKEYKKYINGEDFDSQSIYDEDSYNKEQYEKNLIPNEQKRKELKDKWKALNEQDPNSSSWLEILESVDKYGYNDVSESLDEALQEFKDDSDDVESKIDAYFDNLKKQPGRTAGDNAINLYEKEYYKKAIQNTTKSDAEQKQNFIERMVDRLGLPAGWSKKDAQEYYGNRFDEITKNIKK